MKTTLNQIREKSPCADGWKKLLAYLGKTKADDEPLSLITILDSNGIDDALWCLRAVTGYDREILLYAVWCARQVQHLMTDKRSLDALDVAERYANGLATENELAAASDAAWAAAWADAGFAASLAASNASDGWADAGFAASLAASNASAAARAASAASDASDAWAAASSASDAARATARAAARAAQEKRLREVCAKLCEENMKIRLAETIRARAK